MLNRKMWVAFVVFVTYLMQDTTALKCWKCASDASNSQFCGRNLDTKNLTEEQQLASYVECTKPHNFAQFNAKGEEIVQKCEVYKQIINSYQEVYIRGCTIESKNAPKNECLSAYSDTGYVKTIECHTCDFADGCNGMMDGSDNGASVGVKVSKVIVVSLIILTVLLV